MDRKKREAGAEGSGDKAEQRTLRGREHGKVSPPCAAGAQEREVSPVALDRAERCEISKPERDERTRSGQHDVERLRVECVARRRREAVAEVVDEDDLTGQRPLHAVADLRRLFQRVRRAPRQDGRIDLRLDLPLRPGLRAGNGGDQVRRWDLRQPRRHLLCKCAKRQDGDVRGRLCCCGTEQRVQRLEQHVGRGDERDTGDA